MSLTIRDPENSPQMSGIMCRKFPAVVSNVAHYGFVTRSSQHPGMWDCVVGFHCSILGINAYKHFLVGWLAVDPLMTRLALHLQDGCAVKKPLAMAPCLSGSGPPPTHGQPAVPPLAMSHHLLTGSL